MGLLSFHPFGCGLRHQQSNTSVGAFASPAIPAGYPAAGNEILPSAASGQVVLPNFRAGLDFVRPGGKDASGGPRFHRSNAGRIAVVVCNCRRDHDLQRKRQTKQEKTLSRISAIGKGQNDNKHVRRSSERAN